ncbi:hypothetical protein, partial [Frondihabitans peucedani]|uniref:hypothetical protein n=1 Tax=Frondihabitans peucedani TaxID=598626 RepID=UPI0031D9E01E
MPNYTSAFDSFCFSFGVVDGRVLGFFEIEMDNNRQIVLFFWSASNLQWSAYSGCCCVFLL